MIPCTSFHLWKETNFLKEHKITFEFNQLLQKDKKEVILLNGSPTLIKSEFCNIMAKRNDYHFIEYDFDHFILECPHLNNEKSIIFVKDFLIGYGRIFNSYEREKMLYLPKTSNLVVLQGNNIEKISYTDKEIVRQFKTYNFPKIKKEDLFDYIMDSIQYNNYNHFLYLLEWEKYDINTIKSLDDLYSLVYDMDLFFKEERKYIDKLLLNKEHFFSYMERIINNKITQYNLFSHSNLLNIYSQEFQ
jgi:hypothetical protein